MMKTHPEDTNLFQDSQMISQKDPDVQFLSVPPYYDYSGEYSDQRVLAMYDEGNWRVESQILVDGSWYIASRTSLNMIPDGETEYTSQQKPVRENLGFFTGLPLHMRLILAPIYGLMVIYYCVTGKDINLQVLDDEQ